MRLILKECFVSIKNNLRRYLSILLIILLGVGFFVGIRATSPDMKKTLDNYYDKTNFMDLYIMSTWGIDDNDVSYLENKGYNVSPSYSFDTIVSNGDEKVVKVISYDNKSDVNKITLLKGRYPTKKDECLIEETDFKTTYNIGDKIFANDDKLYNKELTVVGIIKSPIYISLDRGSTKLLSGKINFYTYVPKDNFNMDYYTELYIKLNTNYSTFTNDYSSLIKKEKKKLNNVVKNLSNQKYKNKINELQEDLNNKKKELSIKKEYTFKEINIGQDEINNSKNDYINKKNELDNKKTLLENNLSDSKKEIDSNYDLIDFKEKELIKKQEEFNYLKSDYNIKLSSLNIEKNNLENILLINPNSNDILDKYKMVNYQIDTINNTLSSKEKELNGSFEALKDKKEELDGKNKLINDTYVTNNNLINNSYSNLNSYLDKINTSQIELNSKRNIANREFDKINNTLLESEKQIDNISEPSYYVLDRNTNIGYYSYKADTDRIANLGKVFPIVFFVVAILICLTSMTRMVEEERSQLGTLKALGYTSLQIAFKYIFYSLSSALIGSIIGLVIGFNLLPRIIFNMYSMMYSVSSFTSMFVWKQAIIGTLIAVFCILLATVWAIINELKETPSALMRPKSPKEGKRVILERIKFIWSKLSFTRKVTVRNVFRYKKRFLMTVIGISFCTGLIIAGFGLKDCIIGMVPNQYERIFKYQAELTFKEGITKEEKDKEFERIKNLPGVKNSILILKESIELKNYSTNQTILLVSPYGEISDFIRLGGRNSSIKYNLNDGAVISEKISNLLGINKNSLLKIKTSNDSIDVKVSNITENYLYHFIYLNNKYINEYSYNTVLIKTNSMSDKEEKSLAKEIKKNDLISSINFNSSTRNIFNSTMDNFGFVTVVLIVSAGLLALVVLYNLANVNISERKRELATIKVLGFYDREVYNYIGRESTIMTLIGMFFGIFIGKILTMVIIKTCELDQIMFNTSISIYSYIYSLLITFIFVMLVNFIIYFSLKKIDMIESLKSVE